MSDINLAPVITVAGLAAAFNASRNGINLQIAKVGAGSSGYTVAQNGDGLATQTALKREQETTAIGSGSKVGTHQLDMGFVLDGEGEYWIRELAFYLADGTLFAVWSDPSNAIAHKSAGVPIVVGLELAFTALPAGSVSIKTSGAPIELLFSNPMAVIGTAILNCQFEQLRQSGALDFFKELN